MNLVQDGKQRAPSSNHTTKKRALVVYGEGKVSNAWDMPLFGKVTPPPSDKTHGAAQRNNTGGGLLLLRMRHRGTKLVQRLLRN